MENTKQQQRNFLEGFSFSFFDNCHQSKPSKAVTLYDFLKEVKEGKTTKGIIDSIRKENDKKEREKLKKSLPCVSISGVFEPARNKENLKQYSGLLQIDFDNLSEPDKIKAILKNDPYSFVMFTSPSGNGLKVIVKTPKEPERHESFFNGLQNYYNKKYSLKADLKCSITYC